MIRDFIYYWREYGFALAWTYRRAIAYNSIWVESILNKTDYEDNILGIVASLTEEAELGW